MFENCGSKLKVVAYIEMGIVFVAAFIIMLQPFFKDVSFFACLLTVVAMLLGSYFSALYLYTIGDTWENTVFTSANSVDTRKSIIRPAAPTRQSVETNSHPTEQTSQGAWKCSCGHLNSEVKTSCSKCGRAKE